MSTHGTITIHLNSGDVTFYQHADADTLAGSLARALDRGRSRWDDASYLGRIIFSELVRDDIDGTMGYGILAGDAGDLASDGYAYTVDVEAGTVSWGRGPWSTPTGGQTFQAFIEENIPGARPEPTGGIPYLTARQLDIACEHADELEKDGTTVTREELASYLIERANEERDADPAFGQELDETAEAIRAGAGWSSYIPAR